MANKPLIRIGEVIKPHGIRGELCVDFHVDSPFFLRNIKQFYFVPPMQARDVSKQTPHASLASYLHKVRTWREHKGRVLLTLPQLTDRNGAEQCRGYVVFITEDELPPLDDDEVYCYQLVGTEAFLEDGTLLGTITDVFTPTDEQEIWVIQSPDDIEILFPAHEESVLDVNLEEGTVLISPPPGLLDLYVKE